jgi:hypothetical protein
MAHLGQQSWKLEYSKKKVFSRCWNTNAGLAFGGYDTGYTGATEEYDGSTWTANPTGLNTARSSLAGCGTQTAALAFGGYDGIPPLQQRLKNIMEQLGQIILQD